MMDKVIISCAVTGAIHTPSMSAYLPITPEQIARSAIEAAEAGAAIIHLHARDPMTGAPTPDPAVFMRFLPTIKQSTDAVVNITTGGGLNMTLDDRLAAPLAAKPEMCSLNMGSMNFNISRAGERVKTLYAGGVQALPGQLNLSTGLIVSGESQLNITFPGVLAGGGNTIVWDGSNDSAFMVSGGRESEAL